MSRLEAAKSGTDDGNGSRPDGKYTRTWSTSGEIEYLRLGDNTRLRYLRTGFGEARLVIPKVVDAFTVYAVDLPGMGWSDIGPGASYTEQALRSAIVDFVNSLDLEDVTLAGESMGTTVALTPSTQLGDRVRRVLALNTYDYPKGLVASNSLRVIGCLRGRSSASADAMKPQKTHFHVEGRGFESDYPHKGDFHVQFQKLSRES